MSAFVQEAKAALQSAGSWKGRLWYSHRVGVRFITRIGEDDHIPWPLVGLAPNAGGGVPRVHLTNDHFSREPFENKFLPRTWRMRKRKDLCLNVSHLLCLRWYSGGSGLVRGFGTAQKPNGALLLCGMQKLVVGVTRKRRRTMYSCNFIETRKPFPDGGRRRIQ